MADERDPRVSQRYRELGAEEPPHALDEAILAASRRAVRARPAPLVAPTGRRRWYFPVAAAAVIMLAVAVTVQMERQGPDDAAVVATGPQALPQQPQKEAQLAEEPAATKERKAAPKPQGAPQQFTPEPPPPAAQPPAAPAPQAAEPMRDFAKSNEQAAAAQGSRAQEAPAEALARRDTADRARGVEMGNGLFQYGAPAPAPAPASATKPAPESAAAVGAIASRMITIGPERWLEQIAELRKQGRHEEADKFLAEFRRLYPDYKLSDEMRAKVERK